MITWQELRDADNYVYITAIYATAAREIMQSDLAGTATCLERCSLLLSVLAHAVECESNLQDRVDFELPSSVDKLIELGLID